MIAIILIRIFDDDIPNNMNEEFGLTSKCGTGGKNAGNAGWHQILVKMRDMSRTMRDGWHV